MKRNKNMKVCLCVTRFKKDLTEAISKNFHHLANQLAEKGIAVTVLTPVKSDIGFSKKIVEVIYTEDHPYSSKFRIASNAKIIAEYLNSNMGKFDAVHIHAGFFLEAFLLRFFMKKPSVPVIMTIWQPYLTIKEALRTLKYLFAQPREFIYHFLFNSFALKPFFWYGSGIFDKIIVSSEYQKKIAAGFCGFVDDKKIDIIPNGMIKNPNKHKDKHKNNDSKIKNIIYIGHFTPFKGIDSLLKICHHLKDLLKKDDKQAKNKHVNNGLNITLAWSGYGNFRRINDSIERLELDKNVIFKKKIDVYPELAENDILVVPYRSCIGTSHYHNVLLEAMASGCVAAVSSIGSIPEIIKDNETGIIIDPDDPKRSAEKISMVLGNKNMFDRLSANALKLFNEKFDLKKNTEKHIKLYKGLIDKKQLLLRQH